MTTKRLLIPMLACFALATANATPQHKALTAADFNCFTVIAGSAATVDGSVMMAHNEDDGGEQMLNINMMPQAQWKTGDEFKLQNGGTYTFTHPSARYLWFELPKMDVSDGYLNSHGVAVVSDGCPSREDRTDYSSGQTVCAPTITSKNNNFEGIVYDIRTLTAATARTAREAAKLIGSLAEKWGYASSGRSYCVADSREAWIVSLVQGRQWVAVRIPDDQVMIIPNYYVIDHVNLADTINYMGSPSLVSYATERGWYNPATDGEFRFSRAYSNPGSYTHPDNISREWSALSKLTKKEHKRENYEKYPFSFKPKHKVTVANLIEILSDHYEQTDICAITRNKQTGNPHGEGVGGTVCAGSTQFSTVYQLRPNMPTAIGALVWVAPFHACTQLFAPWYIGMETVPNGWNRYPTAIEALKTHFTDADNFRKNYPNHPYWTAVDLATEVDKDYATNIVPIREAKSAVQQKLFKFQKTFEKQMLKAYKIDSAAVSGELFNYTSNWLTPPTPQMSTPLPAHPATK